MPKWHTFKIAKFWCGENCLLYSNLLPKCFFFFQHECLGRLRIKCADHIEKEKGEIIANIFNIDPDKPPKKCKIIHYLKYVFSVLKRTVSLVNITDRRLLTIYWRTNTHNMILLRNKKINI